MPQVSFPAWSDRVEVLVVDDGSCHNHQKDLLETVRAYPGKSIRLVQRETSGGPSAARNSGIATATGEILVFLDDDCIPGDYFISETARLHAGYPKILLINGNLKALRNDSISRFWFHYYNHAFNRGEGELYQIYRVSSGNFSIKRSLLDRFSPLFDETLPSREDFDLYLRLDCAGIPVFKADSIHAKIECRRTLLALLRQRRWYQQGEMALRQKYGDSFYSQIPPERYPRPSIDFIHVSMLLFIDRQIRKFLDRFARK